jgi:chromosome segregation ATPase
LEKELPEMDKRISETLTTELKRVEERLMATERDVKALTALTKTQLKPLGEKVASIEALQSKLGEEVKKVKPEDVKKAMQRIENLSAKLTQEMKKLAAEKLKEVEERIAAVESSYKKSIEELKTSLGKRIRAIRIAPVVTEKEMREVLDRLIMLETRLATIEKDLEDVKKVKPIVIE